MKRRRLIHIIKETKVIEELIGLGILISIFSLIFLRIEPNVITYIDALWYSFAVVTTIGFGDIVIVTLLGRILSVILGIAGIINVAIITSVVVNYYQANKEER